MFTVDMPGRLVGQVHDRDPAAAVAAGEIGIEDHPDAVGGEHDAIHLIANDHVLLHRRRRERAERAVDTDALFAVGGDGAPLKLAVAAALEVHSTPSAPFRAKTLD